MSALEAAAELRKSLNDELQNSCPPPHVLKVIKSREVRWAGHVSRVGELRGGYKMLAGKLKGERPLERFKRM
jgi:hypothetical protein